MSLCATQCFVFRAIHTVKRMHISKHSSRSQLIRNMTKLDHFSMKLRWVEHYLAIVPSPFLFFKNNQTGKIAILKKYLKLEI